MTNLKIFKQNNRYGLQDEENHIIYPPIFEMLKLHHASTFVYRLNRKLGLCKGDGSILLKNKFNKMWRLTDSLFKVGIDSMFRNRESELQYGIYDIEGNEIIAPICDYISGITHNYLIISMSNKWGLLNIDTLNYQLLDNVSFLGLVSDDVCRFNIDGEVEIIKPGQKYYRSEQDHYRIVNGKTVKIRVKNGKWGYKNLCGETIILATFDYAYSFSEERACVKIRGKYGFIDKTGSFIVQPEYDQLESNFKNGSGKLKKEGKIFTFDLSGRIIDKYDELPDIDDRYDDYPDDTPSIYNNPYYNDNLDMDQQSIDFWNSL